MVEKKTGIWFGVMAIIAVVGFIAPGMVRNMFKSGALSEDAATAIIALSIPITMLAAICAISLLIFMILKKINRTE